jgi:hypothetical protein
MEINKLHHGRQRHDGAPGTKRRASSGRCTDLPFLHNVYISQRSYHCIKEKVKSVQKDYRTDVNKGTQSDSGENCPGQL